MDSVRLQLTLFVSELQESIEKIRSTFNPIQYDLIPAHITLCREDEIVPAVVIENIKSIIWDSPLTIEFDSVERFNDGKGVLMPAKPSEDFNRLRKNILKGITDSPREHQPHITLMHPRNSTCTYEIFSSIQKYSLPTELHFNKISLIEQTNGGCWRVKDQFQFFKASD